MHTSDIVHRGIDRGRHLQPRLSASLSTASETSETESCQREYVSHFRTPAALWVSSFFSPLVSDLAVRSGFLECTTISLFVPPSISATGQILASISLAEE